MPLDLTGLSPEQINAIRGTGIDEDRLLLQDLDKRLKELLNG